MRNAPPFSDRLEAARLLAAALQQHRGQHPLVLAVPRGAVPMGRVIAEALDGELDVVQVRKLGSPWNPEVAIGAVDESGWRTLSEQAAQLGADAEYIEQATIEEVARMRRRRARWSPLRPPINPQGRCVIVVDDGVATGQSMIAALHSVRSRHPARLVCAVAVAPPDTLRRLQRLADEVVCLASPEDFEAVGSYYLDFRQVEDAEVEAVLAQSSRRGS